MPLIGLHELTSSTDATSTTSYEYFRNELIKLNENAHLKAGEQGYLGLLTDSVGHLFIGYGYDLYVRPAADSAAMLASHLAAGVTITARQIEYMDALRGTKGNGVSRAINLPGDPLNGLIPTQKQVSESPRLP